MSTLRAEAVPLSLPQEVLRLAEQMRPGTVLDPRCVVHRAFAFDRTPDLGLLGEVLTAVVDRHDATRLVPVGEPVTSQALRPVRPVEVKRERAVTDPHVLTRAVTAAATRPFDLVDGPLLRGAWVPQDDAGVFVMSLHHWVGDGGALDALQRDVERLYGALRAGASIPPRPPQYRDFAREGRDRRPDDATIDWWTAALRGLRRAALPVAAGTDRSGVTALVSAVLPQEVHEALRHLVSAHRASPFMVLLAALTGLLDDGRDGRDLTVFAIHDRRSLVNRDVIGFLSEPLPLRLRFAGHPSFPRAVAAARGAVTAAQRRRSVAFTQLLASSPRLAVALLRGRRPATLVQHLTVRALDLGGLVGRPLPTFGAAEAGAPYPSTLPIDLNVTVERCGDVHHVGVLYDSGLWRAADIEAAVAGLGHALREAAAAG